MLMVIVLLLVQVAFETIQNEVVLFYPNLCPIWQAVGLAAVLRSEDSWELLFHVPSDFVSEELAPPRATGNLSRQIG